MVLWAIWLHWNEVIFKKTICTDEVVHNVEGLYFDFPIPHREVDYILIIF